MGSARALPGDAVAALRLIAVVAGSLGDTGGGGGGAGAQKASGCGAGQGLVAATAPPAKRAMT